jgi:leucyl/phenylalanyl-tRNA---protein transferase
VTAPQIGWISRHDPPEAFPPADTALASPNGLLAAGADLAPDRLLYAYRHGIFPWFESGQPILWWSPDPRSVLRPAEFHLQRRLRRSLRASPLGISFNAAFTDVMLACAKRRRRRHHGTWITADMVDAYRELHRLGWAHSVEVWRDSELVGGIYGLAIGHAFFGESMFSRISNGSKIAMLALCRELVRRDFLLLDCQVPSPHLETLGAQRIPRRRFLGELRLACSPASRLDGWPEGTSAASSLVESSAQPSAR